MIRSNRSFVGYYFYTKAKTMFEIAGKVGLVTGAVSGIGLAFVHELLQNGVKGISLVDIDEKRAQSTVDEIEKRYEKDRVIFVKADVRDREQIKGAFETTVKTFKQLDIVINNAGIVQELQWEKCVAVNLTAVLTGSFLAMETYLPKYKSGSEGVIVNTASMSSIVPLTDGPVYSATKAGVVHFTRSIGSDIRYENHKIRAVAICPGFTNTDLLQLNENQINEPYRSRFIEMYRKGRKQTAEDVAKNLISIIKEAPNGSVWSVICGQTNQIKFS